MPPTLIPLLLSLFILLFPTNSSLLNITSQSQFHTTITTNKYIITLFYAPWCTHCKNITPQFYQLAQLLQHNSIHAAQIDAASLPNITQIYHVTAFPTIIFFVDATPLHYQGSTNPQSIYQWILKVTQTQLDVIHHDQVQLLQQTQTFVLYSGNNPDLLQVFQLLKISHPNTHYYHQINNDQSITLYRPNTHPISYSQKQPLTVQAIKYWVLITTLDIIVPLSTKENLEYVFYDTRTQKDVALLIKEKDLGQSIFKRIESVCEANKDKLKCCYVDNTMEMYSGVKSYVRSRGQTILTLTRDTLKEAYRYDLPLAEISEQTWSSFIQQVSENKHKNIASAETEQLEFQYVKILTSSNYSSFIEAYDAVLVQYVAPGCAKCSELAEQYDLLAKDVYSNDIVNVEIAAIDLRKNMEVASELKIMEHPTFWLYLSGAHIEFKGNKTIKEIWKFVQKNLKLKPIKVRSIAEVPTPSVIIYDFAQVTVLNHLPALFTRYPVYHLQDGRSTTVVLRHNDEEFTFPSNELKTNVQSVSSWLMRQTDPILVNMLQTSVEGKLKEALSNQIPLLGLINVETELSASLRKTLEEYCKGHKQVVCGYAKKGEDHFEELTAWVGIQKDLTTSHVIYINTKSFDKFIFTESIDQLSVENLEQFVSDIQDGKAIKHTKANAQGEQKDQTGQESPGQL